MNDLKQDILKHFLTPVLSLLFLAFIRWQYGVILFHTLAELFSVAVGIIMMVIVWNTRRFTHNDFLVYLGTGYFWIAVLDSWHTFTLKEMPFFDINNSGVTLHFWIYTRILEALLLLTALIFLKRKLNARLMASCCAALTLLIVWASLSLKQPVMITSEGLTAFKVNAEYLIIFLLAATFFAYIKQREYLAPKVLLYVLISLVLTIFAELSFTLYDNFEGMAFVIGHLFKFLSFWMIYLAIVRTTLIEPFSVLAKNSSSYVAIPHPAIVVDSRGTISQLNRAAEKYSGKASHQLIHKPVHDFFHPSTLSEKNCELCIAIKQGRALKNHIVLFPEKRQWFLASLAPIQLNDKNSGMVLSLTDITERKNIEKELLLLKEKTEANERKFKAITNQSSEGITVADPAGNYTFVNDTFCKMMGYSEQELLQMTVFDMKAPEQDTSSFDRSKSSEEGLPVQVLLQRKDGSTFISEVIGKRIEIHGDDQVLGTIRDITQQVNADKKLKKSEKNLAEAQQVAQLGCWELDITKNELSWSAEIFRIFEIDPDKFTASYEAFIAAVHPEDRALVKKAYTDSLNSGQPYNIEHRLLMKDGRIKHVNERCETSYDENNKPVRSIGTVLDITVRKQQEEHILHQAHFDALTDLPNRFLALDRLNQLLNEAKRKNEKVAVLFLDLDDFKKVNDTLGHEMGDKLLIEAAERLRSVSRSGDTVGRLGGDEFIMLLSGLKNTTDASPVAENLLNQFKDSFKIDDRELILTMSIGISVFPDDAHETTELLRNADSAMYHAKELGRNTYSYFTSAMNLEVSRRLALEEQIHGALHRNEFSVLYQPQVIINSRKIFAVEALARWNNPVLGQVSPEEFIPIAEQTGLITALGQFVLTRALNTTARWQQELNEKIRIAVNLSPRQFRDPELVNFIEQALKQANVSAQLLELEITEGVLMNGHKQVAEALTTLNKQGINIAMDDFGVGYSSLSYLRQYPFDVLKIDRSFIHDITEDIKDRELISAAVAMAHSLKLKVVAEGIETEEQLAYLKQLACDYGQGYLFSQPVSADEITKLLKQQRLSD